jgi:hypothetical protein
MADESARSEDEIPSNASNPKGEPVDASSHQRTQNVFVSACAAEQGADVCAMMDSISLMFRRPLSCGIRAKSVPWEGGSV